jgi:hypothetical protein
MHSGQTRGERRAKRSIRRQLDTLVVNIELTLTSIIQGVALSVLTESSRAPLGDLRFDQWPYVANGLLVILLFFLYIACTLVEAITFTDLTDPLRWYAFSAAFGVSAWALFLADLRLIRQRHDEALGPAEEELYGLILRDQQMNILLLVPSLTLYNLIAIVSIHLWPAVLIRGGGHVVFAALQTVTLFGDLMYVVRFFAKIAPLVLKANEEEAVE